MPRLPPVMTTTLSVKICSPNPDALYWNSRTNIATSAKIETNHTRLRANGIWLKYSGT